MAVLSSTFGAAKAAIAAGAGRPVRAAGSLSEALRWVTADPVVLITGSLYLIGEAVTLLGLESSAGDAWLARVPLPDVGVEGLLSALP